MTEKEKAMAHEMPEYLPELPEGLVYLGRGPLDIAGLRVASDEIYIAGNELFATEGGWERCDHFLERVGTRSSGDFVGGNEAWHYAAPVNSDLGRKILAERGKPSWADAPDWAEWLAQDADGDWYWYDTLPSIDEPSQSWDLGEIWERTDQAGCGQPNPNWRTTLERRPESELTGIQRGMDEALGRIEEWVGMPDGWEPPPQLIIPSEVCDGNAMLATMVASARAEGYRIEWDSNGIRGWKE